MIVREAADFQPPKKGLNFTLAKDAVTRCAGIVRRQPERRIIFEKVLPYAPAKHRTDKLPALLCLTFATAFSNLIQEFSDLAAANACRGSQPHAGKGAQEATLHFGACSQTCETFSLHVALYEGVYRDAASLLGAGRLPFSKHISARTPGARELVSLVSSLLQGDIRIPAERQSTPLAALDAESEIPRDHPVGSDSGGQTTAA
ncbi:MAG: hypothetical protein JWM36_531 [Hyphomicrobiales bacterium]|nr:hypothetical protein [Hyphomicrobiales bacterium]